jgi:hypothetical protein
MSEVTIAHIIGTVSLMALFFCVGSYYSLSFVSMKQEITSVQLEKVSKYFAANIVDLVSLSYMSETNQLIIKRLDIPNSLMGYGYAVEIFSTTEGITVKSSLLSISTVSGETALPWGSDAKIHVYNQTCTEVEQYIQAKQPSLNPDVEVFSSQFNIVAWCLKQDNEITIGVGTLD